MGMGGLERAMECLRPLVEMKTWDYCVVWKLGDDPSRFIEWMDCCCGGGYRPLLTNLKVKRENQRQQHLCRDNHSKHPVWTRACEALAQFPSFMPLYSGIHGEVVVSAQPKWLSHDTNALDSNLSQGTQVLIPVVGGLIELFVAKHVPKDQNIIDYVTVQCHIPLEQEVLIRSCNNVSPPNEEIHFDHSLLRDYADNLPTVMHGLQHPSSVLDSSPSPAQLTRKSSKKPNHHYSESLLKQQLGLVSAKSTPLVENENEKKSGQKPTEEKEYQSKNLITERNRRTRINDGLYTLRALVPKITKMDKAAILGDAIDYIVELQQEVKKLKDELENDRDDCNVKDAELRRSSGYSTATNEQNQDGSAPRQMAAQRAEVEVKVIGTREFRLQLLYQQKGGRFTRLMQGINDLGLQVVDVNMTTFNGRVLNIFTVEANKEVQPKKLRDLLIDITS